MSSPLTVTATVRDASGNTTTATAAATISNGIMAQPSSTLPVVNFNRDLFRAGDAGILPGLNRLTRLSQVTFDPGVYSFSDFSQFATYGVYHAFLGGIFGLTANPADTVLQMVANTSTVASPASGSNSLALIRIGLSTAPAVFCGNFTVLGTAQSATRAYNGLIIYKGGAGSQVANIVIRGQKGYANFPPGETYGLGFFQCVGSATNKITARDIEVSGINADGQLVGTSPIGWASSSFIDVTNAYCHDAYAGMPTFWQATDCTTTNLRSDRQGSGTGSLGGCGINHEESTRIVHNNPTLNVSTQPGNPALYQHISVASQNFDCAVTIKNPTWDHPAYIGGNQFSIMIPSNYPPGQQLEKVTGNLVSIVDAAGAPVPTKVYH